jgi:hypothetical protein
MQNTANKFTATQTKQATNLREQTISNTMHKTNGKQNKHRKHANKNSKQSKRNRNKPASPGMKRQSDLYDTARAVLRHSSNKTNKMQNAQQTNSRRHKQNKQQTYTSKQ